MPKDVREALLLGAGDRIRYIMLPGGEVRILKIGSVRRLKGALALKGEKTVSLDEMESAIARGAGE